MFKNIISKIISIVIFICLLPLLLIISIIILVDDGSPIIFRQKRVGRGNTLFWIYKFRTMKKNTGDIPSHLIKDSASLFTKSGPLLRKFSLDELPQLINIIKGDMLFIGPRPALYNQNDLIKLRTNLSIHKLYPGVTGWAQINGRDQISIKGKVKMDEFYLNHKSLWMDLRIIYFTIIKTLKKEDISH